MALSQNIISQFAKTMTPKTQSTETTVNGTFKVINGKEYVQLDGSDILTPVKSTVVADSGDRVKVLLKDHMATVNGNITSPSARSKDVNNLKDEVDEFGNTIKILDSSIKQQETSIIQMQTNINQHNTTINQHDTYISQLNDNIVSLNNDILLQNNQISAIQNDINLQGNKINSINNTIDSQNNQIIEMNNSIVNINNNIKSYNNTIEQMGNKIIEFNNTVNSQGNQITQINNNISQTNDIVASHDNTILSQGNNITILNSAFKIEDGKLTGLSEAVIDALRTGTLNAEYAMIDFANIGEAAVQQLFADSGIIDDLIMKDGKVTGELVGVTIKGDIIEGNTVKADKLIIKGDDGLYYKLNVDALGETTASSDEKYQNGLDGSVIIAKSVTANKVNVDDLVAFGATIGNFTISDDSIHSGAKSSISSTIPGIYLGSDGEFATGDNNNYVKFFQDVNNKWKLDIKADTIRYGSEGISVEMGMNNMSSTIRETGGSNLLRNSVGYSGTDFWTVTDISKIKTKQDESMSFSGSEFILTGAVSLSQIYNTEIGNKYSVSCKIKHVSNGTAGTVKIFIRGNGKDKIIYESSEAHSEWYHIKLDPYEATINNAELIVSLEDDSNNDTLEITDLIVSNGDTNVWSGYFDEVYSKAHRLDKNGLTFIDNNSESKNTSLLNSTSLAFYENNTIISGLSKDKLLTNETMIKSSHTLGKLRTVVLDDNNIIEYI